MFKKISDTQKKKLYLGKHLEGRILSYDKASGYGFIVIENGVDFFLSSYKFAERNEKKAVIGAVVEFDVGESEGNVCACNVIVTNKYPWQHSIWIGKEPFPLSTVTKIEVKDARIHALEVYPELQNADFSKYPEWMYDILEVTTKYGVFNFCSEGSFLIGNGQINVKEESEILFRQLFNFSYDYDRRFRPSIKNIA